MGELNGRFYQPACLPDSVLPFSSFAISSIILFQPHSPYITPFSKPTLVYPDRYRRDGNL